MGAHPTAQAAATKEHTLLLAVKGFTTWLKLTGKLHQQLSQQPHRLHRLVSQQHHQLHNLQLHLQHSLSRHLQSQLQERL